jgi:peptidoglycan/LPS O-acetylase OafA/YrhL
MFAKAGARVAAGWNWTLGKLARVTSGDGLIYEIDGLRLIAILGTIITHQSTFMLKHGPAGTRDLVAGNLFCQWMSAGYVGVQLFFAISGFILAIPFARACTTGRPAPTLKKFYLRRLTRIEPPYIINLILFLGILVVGRGDSLNQLWPHFAASCGYLHNFFFHTPSLINGVAWSLEVEVQFYILAPLFALVFRIPSTVVRRSTILAALMASAAYGQSFYRDHGYAISTELCHFLVGFLMADIYLVDWKASAPQRRWTFDLVGVGSLLTLIEFTRRFGTNRFVVPGLLLLIMIGAFRGPLFSSLLRRPTAYTLGGTCYSTYLYHYWIMTIVGWAVVRFLPIPQNLAFQAVYLAAFMWPAVFAGSAVMFVLTEKPFMNPAWPGQVRNWIAGWSGSRRDEQPVSAGPGAAEAGVVATEDKAAA